MSKHTQGKWYIDGRVLVTDEYEIAYEADVCNGMTREQMDANFILMSSAPELYEALKWFVENDDTINRPENQYWLDGLQRGIDAIAKAEGKDA